MNPRTWIRNLDGFTGRSTVVLWYHAPVPGSTMSEAPEQSRRDLLLGMIQKEFPAYHPLISIARIAHHGDADLKLQFECHKTIAKYVEPELKSIEVKGEITGRHRVSVSLFEPQGAEFHPVEAGMRPVIDGQAQKALGSGATVKELPGGAIVDLDPVVTDRVVTDGW